jgi:hypothetical protein
MLSITRYWLVLRSSTKPSRAVIILPKSQELHFQQWVTTACPLQSCRRESGHRLKPRWTATGRQLPTAVHASFMTDFIEFVWALCSLKGTGWPVKTQEHGWHDQSVLNYPTTLNNLTDNACFLLPRRVSGVNQEGLWEQRAFLFHPTQSSKDSTRCCCKSSHNPWP